MPPVRLSITHISYVGFAPVELSVIRLRRQVRLVERDRRAVQIDLAADAAQARAEGAIDLDRVGSGLRIMVAHGAPFSAIFRRR